ncbi:hypothetical protein F2Q69_00061425 [Brassica cretica]|uniref:Uncharacterized protein n=1 Tax=Brassica cretica TaxID=69181 RepID=A0A8S9RIM3_BRACR|nr:hypothetical protein F2Q69_00061425 [Brassica cretica]
MSGSVVVLKSVAQPESHQTFQTCHLGDTSDRGSVQGAYLKNQKDFRHETNFYRRPTKQFITKVWNYKKRFKEEEVVDFTNWRLPSLSSSEYQPLEVDFRPTMKRPSLEIFMDFKMNSLNFQKALIQKNWSRENQDAINFPKPAKPTSIMESCQPLQFGSNKNFLWKPGDHIIHTEDIQDVLRCTSTQRIMQILIYFNLPYLKSQALKLKQLFFLQSMHDISTFQTIKRIPGSSLTPQTVQIQGEHYLHSFGQDSHY